MPKPARGFAPLTDLTRRSARAETIIDVQKKVAALLGLMPGGGAP